MTPDIPFAAPHQLLCPTFFASVVKPQEVIDAMRVVQQMAQSLPAQPRLARDATASTASSQPSAEALQWGPMAEAYIWNGVPMAYRHFLPTQDAIATERLLKSIWPDFVDLALYGAKAVLSGVTGSAHVAAIWSTHGESDRLTGTVSTIDLSRSALDTSPPKWLPQGSKIQFHALFPNGSNTGFSAHAMWQVPHSPAMLIQKIETYFLSAGWQPNVSNAWDWSRGECRVRFETQGALDASPTLLLGFSGAGS